MSSDDDRRRIPVHLRLLLVVVGLWFGSMTETEWASAQSGSHDNPWSVEPNRPYPKRTPAPPTADANPLRPNRHVP